MKLEELFASILAIPQTHLTNTSSPATVKSWDSLAHMRLLVSMEEVYGISFTSVEMKAMQSLGDARRLLAQKGVE